MAQNRDAVVKLTVEPYEGRDLAAEAKDDRSLIGKTDGPQSKSLGVDAIWDSLSCSSGVEVQLKVNAW